MTNTEKVVLSQPFDTPHFDRAAIQIAKRLFNRRLLELNATSFQVFTLFLQKITLTLPQLATHSFQETTNRLGFVALIIKSSDRRME